MDFPKAVVGTRLFRHLSKDVEFISELSSLRQIVTDLADRTSHTVPGFTDHTIRHMDGLWLVADAVLLPDETEVLSPGEAFLLAASFYLHDAGMAFTATASGVEIVKSSPTYEALKLAHSCGEGTSIYSDAAVLAAAARVMHGPAAARLAEEPVPGTDVYLFQRPVFRQKWAHTVGLVSASHHQDLGALFNQMGPQGSMPLPDSHDADLFYVCCCLRLVDYAHINRERASTIVRAFRAPLGRESLQHWLAQENIDGPKRVEDELVYRSGAPISDTDAWWLFYEMMSGLDQEIRDVRRYLDHRAGGLRRLSLSGVRGAVRPEEAARFIPTSGFLPIEANLRAGSIDRIVNLLASETLYGSNFMAPIRELVQNARDAVLLKEAVATHELDRATTDMPIQLRASTVGSEPFVEIIDFGIGMSRTVMLEYLISIASDYWDSQFYKDFPDAASAGFKQAGKFGIGFLSVFMLGPEVSVESNRPGASRYRLRLRGLGRRGEIQEVSGASGSGTSIRVGLNASAAKEMKNLSGRIRHFAPTLPRQLKVDVDGHAEIIPQSWHLTLPAVAFLEWLSGAIADVSRSHGSFGSEIRSAPRIGQMPWYYLSHRYDKQGAEVWPAGCPEYVAGNTRLIAAGRGISLVCVRGLTVEAVRTPGFSGIIELNEASTDVSRSRIREADINSVLDAARKAVRKSVTGNLNKLSESTFIVGQAGFVSRCVGFYGQEVLNQSDAPWISLLERPGNVSIKTTKQISDELLNARSILIVYNTGPWTAIKKLVEWQSIGEAIDLAVVLDGDDQPTPDYFASADEIKSGTLNELWSDWSDSPLFANLVAITSQVWQISTQNLLHEPSWKLRRSTIEGVFRRP